MTHTRGERCAGSRFLFIYLDELNIQAKGLFCSGPAAPLCSSSRPRLPLPGSHSHTLGARRLSQAPRARPGPSCRAGMHPALACSSRHQELTVGFGCKLTNNLVQIAPF